MALHEHTGRKEPMSQRELRGVPLVGGGRSSAMPGTAPLPALLSKEEAGKLDLFPEKLQEITRSTLSRTYERKGPPTVTRATRESGRFFRG